MIGGVGVGMEFSKSAAFYVIFREPGKTERFAEQLSTSLMENVRSQPIPDSDVAAEEGALIQEQLEKSLEDVDATISVFQMGRFSAEKGILSHSGTIPIPIHKDLQLRSLGYFCCHMMN